MFVELSAVAPPDVDIVAFRKTAIRGNFTARVDEGQIQTLRDNLAPKDDTDASEDGSKPAVPVAGTDGVTDDTATEQQPLTVFQSDDI